MSFFVCFKYTFDDVKRQPAEWGKILANCVFDIVCNMYTKLLPLKNKKTSNPILKRKKKS